MKARILVLAAALGAAMTFVGVPAAQADSSDQGVYVYVADAGVLSVWSWDSYANATSWPGAPVRVNLGPVYYLNTLPDGDWSTTVTLTQFYPEDSESASRIGYDNFALSPGWDFRVPGDEEGDVYVDAYPGDYQQFSGENPEVSDPLTLSSFEQDQHGEFLQSGNWLDGTIPVDVQPMEYGATLTYTVMSA